jgi:transcription antitermination factor NusG
MAKRRAAGKLHLIGCKTQTERSVVRKLREISVQAYAPRYTELGPRGWVEHQLFPSYVFVWVIDQYRAIRAIPGVYDFILSCGELAVLDESIVKKLRARENGYGYVRLHDSFEIGQSVRYGDDGPIGLCLGPDSKSRIRVLFDHILGRQVEMSIPERELVAA